MARLDEQQRIRRDLNDLASHATEEPASRSGEAVCCHCDQAGRIVFGIIDNNRGRRGRRNIRRQFSLGIPRYFQEAKKAGARLDP